MATEENTAHPLENEWVLWEHAGGTKDPNAWKDNMKQLCSFHTLEDFWRYFNHIPKPSEVFYDGESEKRVGSEGRTVKEYSLFKRGIEPEWGDPENRTGGEWFCRQQIEGPHLNIYWQNLVLGVIGNTIDQADSNSGTRYVNGARVVDKGKHYPLFRLELWISTKDADIRNRLKDRLNNIITDGCPIPKKGHPSFDWEDHS